MKKTLIVCTLLGGVLCQSSFATSVVPEVGSTFGLLGLAMAGIATFSWKRNK
jgi:hypothetical protein